jgi:dTDP-4-dehydrorhamnose 3,5-epimerase
VRLSGENFRQLYVPPGFAHGFCVVSAQVHVEYKCTGVLRSGRRDLHRLGRPEIGIEWPIGEPTVSAKDKRAQRLKEMIDRLG